MEVAMIIVGLALAGIFFLPMLAKSKRRSSKIGCINNVKQITLGFRIWSNDSDDKFPWMFSNNGMAINGPGTLELIPIMAPEVHFRAASNEFSTTRILLCPNDTERSWATNWNSFTRSNLSYFVNVDADPSYPQSILIGDRNLMINKNPVKPGLAIVTTNQNLGWDKNMHNENGNLGLSDGSAQQVTAAGLNKQFQASSLPTNRLVIP
jgi:hypothetical protein